MARVSRGVTARARHKKVIKRAKGYYGRRKNVFRVAVQAVERGMQYAYRDRRKRKSDFRGLWIQRINAGIFFTNGVVSYLADLLTRFSGITMTCVVTGVIWLMKPSSLMDVLLTDYLHVSLYVGGLYFALRGNTKYGV